MWTCKEFVQEKSGDKGDRVTQKLLVTNLLPRLPGWLAAVERAFFVIGEALGTICTFLALPGVD